jgi:hypothetical protein
LSAVAGFIAGALDVRQGHKEVEDSGEEMPILSAASKEGAKVELVADGFVDVDGSEIALAGGGDVEAEA